MSFRRMIVASGATSLVLAAIGGAALSRLPAGTQLPTHWNAAGEADRFADAGTALFMPVALTIVVSLVFAAIPRIEPLQDRLDKSATLLRSAWIGLLGLMMLIELVVAAPAFGWTLPATLPLAGVGLLLIVIGNALPKSRPGFFVGIRTPWTLTDPDNWVATHRLGGWTMALGGAMMVAAAFLPIDAAGRAGLMIAALIVAVVPPLGYSFWFFWSRRGPA